MHPSPRGDTSSPCRPNLRCFTSYSMSSRGFRTGRRRKIRLYPWAFPPILTPRGRARHTLRLWLPTLHHPPAGSPAGGGVAPQKGWALGVVGCNHNLKVRITPEPISGALRDGFFVWFSL